MHLKKQDSAQDGGNNQNKLALQVHHFLSLCYVQLYFLFPKTSTLYFISPTIFTFIHICTIVFPLSIISSHRYHNATMINFQPGITVATELIGVQICNLKSKIGNSFFDASSLSQELLGNKQSHVALQCNLLKYYYYFLYLIVVYVSVLYCNLLTIYL